MGAGMQLENASGLDFMENMLRKMLISPWFTMVTLALLAVLAFTQLDKVKVDASSESLVLEGDEDLAFYRELVKRYSTEDALIVTVQFQGSVLSDDSLDLIERLRDKLKTIEGVSSVLSILDVPLLYSPPISLTDLSSIKFLSDEGVDRELVAVELRQSPIYEQLLSSLDGKVTAIQVNLTRDDKYNRLLDQRDALREQLADDKANDSLQVQLTQAEKAFKNYSAEAAKKQSLRVESTRQLLQTFRDENAQVNIYLGVYP